MYYVSDVRNLIMDGNFSRYDRISITDTSDGITETYRNADIVKALYRQRSQFEHPIHVYGMYFYGRDKMNMYAFAKKLVLGQTIDERAFMSLLTGISKLHNPWTVAELEDYIVQLQENTIIRVKGMFDSGTNFSFLAKRVDVDTWSIQHNLNFPDVDTLNSLYLARELVTFPISSIYSFSK